MAYGLKYELLCKSKKGIARSLQLLFDGYSSADIDRNMPSDSPLVLRKDKAAVVRGTSLDFAIREAVDFELDEFYTNNPKKIKSLLYEGATLIWAGYNLPQQYDAPYIKAPLSIRFTATDGLGLLKNEKFTLTGINTQLEIIIYCIDKIGLGLDYSIAINLFESSHATNRSPLAQTDEDAYVFNGLDCYTVLEKILNKYDAEITQVNGKWHITRSTDKKSTRMVYTSAGVYSTTEAAPAVLDLGYPDTSGVEVWPVGILNRSLEPGAKKVTIKHEFGRKSSLLNNYEFWRYAGGQFTGWTQTGTFTLSQRIKEGKAYAFLSGYSADATHAISQEIPIVNAAGEDFVFEVDFAPVGRTAGSINGISSMMMTVKMLVAVGDGVTNWYLTKTGWTTTLTYIEETVTSSLVSPVWNRLKIITDGLPCDGGLHVSLFRYYLSGSPRPEDSYSGIGFSEPLAYFMNDGELYPSGLETVAEFDNSTEPGDLGTIELLTADAPDLLNNGQLYEHITKLTDGSPTEGWVNNEGSTTAYSQVIQLARTLASNNRIARQKLTGTIKGTGLKLNSIVKHTYNSSREFELAEVQWNLYEESWSVTMLELLAWSDEDITFTTESENGASVSSTTAGGSIIGVVSSNDAGPQGVAGAQGPAGNQGTAGTQGGPGFQGATGIAGTGGPQGATGVTGSQGYTGNPGAQGLQGWTGAQGMNGTQGVQGFVGMGTQGANGAQGYYGITGAQGATGSTGSTGPQGTAGTQGGPGAQGTAGTNGTNGSQGVPGYQGYAGAQGATGADGATGAQGTTGTQGGPGTQGAQGASGSTQSTYFQFNPQGSPPAGAQGRVYCSTSGIFYGYDGANWDQLN